MWYSTSLIGGPSTLATFSAVYSLFGPTFPGIHDRSRGLYTLFYSVLSLAFPMPAQSMQIAVTTKKLIWPWSFLIEQLLLLVVSSVYDPSTDCKVGLGSSMVKACLPPLAAGSCYMEEVQVKLGEELWFTVGGQLIPVDASAQDVWTYLGRPFRIHQKQVNRLAIHSGDYFYNYFTRGFDNLFDGQTHRIKKFVLHTNYPGHADFNSYMKCNFVIHYSDYDGSLLQDVAITPSSKWEQVKEILGDSGPAAIQKHGSSTVYPFGSIFVYGYPNTAFEVMKNGYIATVTLFRS